MTTFPFLLFQFSILFPNRVDEIENTQPIRLNWVIDFFSRFRGKMEGEEEEEEAVKVMLLRCQKLSLDNVPRSPKNPNALKPRKDVQFRFGNKRPLAQAMIRENLDNLSWADVEKYLARDKEVVVVGSVDKRVLDEAKERKEEPDELFFRSSESLRRAAHEYATAAISYMRKEGHILELVKPCLFNSGATGMGIMTHFNFKAKRADDPSAPVETYFGQLHVGDDSAMVVECCVSLGASDSLPYERDNRGCRYCCDYVHHPEGGCKGIIWGRLTWSPETNRLVLT